MRNIVHPIKLENVCTVSIVMLDDRFQHGVDCHVKIGRHNEIFDAGNQFALCGKVLLCVIQLGNIPSDVNGFLHAAQSAVILDQAVMQQHIADRRVLPYPCDTMVLTVLQSPIRAERAGRFRTLQMLVALYARRKCAEPIAATAVEEQQLIRFRVADVNNFVELVEQLVNIHSESPV